MCEGVLPATIKCTAFVPGTLGGRKKAPDPLELELEWLRAAMWMLGTEQESSARAASVLNLLTISLAMICF